MSELEQALGVLARELDVPETPDLATAVLAELEPRKPRRVERGRWIVAVAVVVFAALAATLAIPDARAALFRWLSIGGERIELVDELPEIPVQDDLELALGEPVTLEEARRRSVRSRSNGPSNASRSRSSSRTGAAGIARRLATRPDGFRWPASGHGLTA